jgi:endonuclease/exonuclease/phosphatase family metal-dependent hydrolase
VLAKSRFFGALRLFSYNILDGGEGRADPLAEVIEAQRADVVALIEADNSDVLNRISKRLKMDIIVGQGKRHAVALLSRFPIIQTINHGALGEKPDCLLEALIRTPAGEEVTLGILHLHPHAREQDEAIREEELDSVLQIFELHRRQRKPHLLVGDFNADSPTQMLDMEKCKPSTREEWRQNGGHIPRRAIQKLLTAGYLDSYFALKPEQAKSTGTFTTQFPGQRVDYIFTYGLPPSRLKDAWIEQDRLAKYASDHFPIGLEIS